MIKMLNRLLNYDSNTENLKIFDYEIIRSKVPKKLYNNPRLEESIHETFEKLENIDICKDTKESIGKVTTTVGLKNTNFFISNLNDIKPLIDYISKIVLKNFFGEKFHKNNVTIISMWMNKLFYNSSVRCHTHRKNEHKSAVAIFYFKVPKNGSKLIILKEDIGDKIVTEEHKNISHYIELESGDLIIHSPDIPHAVSTHESKESRICLVFNFELKK